MDAFIARLNEVIIFPLIALLIAAGLLFFLWGALQFVIGAADESARATGKRHMLYGIIGMVVMVSAYAILALFLESFGI